MVKQIEKTNESRKQTNKEKKYLIENWLRIKVKFKQKKRKIVFDLIFIEQKKRKEKSYITTI